LEKMRESCILEYWLPYERVQLSKMAYDLNIPQDELEDLVETLMYQGALKHCRMDCRAKCLIRDNDNHITKQNPAQETRRKMNRLRQRVMDDTYSMIIRMACMEHDMVVSDPQSKQGRRGRRGGGDGAGPDGGAGFDYDDNHDVEDNSSDGMFEFLLIRLYCYWRIVIVIHRLCDCMYWYLGLIIHPTLFIA